MGSSVGKIQENSKVLEYSKSIEKLFNEHKNTLLDAIEKDFKQTGQHSSEEISKLSESLFRRLKSDQVSSTGSIHKYLKNLPNTLRVFKNIQTPEQGEIMKTTVEGSCECSLYESTLLSKSGGDDTSSDDIWQVEKDMIETSKTRKELVDKIYNILKESGLIDSSKIKTTMVEKSEELKNVIKLNSLKKLNDDQLENVIIKLRNAINSTLGGDLIPVNVNHKVAIKIIAEVIYATTSSMILEFSTIKKRIVKIMDTIKLLLTFLEELQKKTTEHIAETTTDASTKMYFKEKQTLNNQLYSELKRQYTLLEGLLTNRIEAFKSVDTIYKELLTSGKMLDQTDTIQKNNIAKYIYDVMSNLGNMRLVEHHIEDALKTLNIKLDEYKKMSNLSELYDKLAKLLASGSLSEDEKDKYIRSGEILIYHFKHYPRSGLKKGSDEDSLDSTKFISPSIAKHIRNTTKSKLIIFQSFSNELNSVFDTFIKSLMDMTEHIGTGKITITTELDTLRRLIGRIDGKLVTREKIYEALIGYHSDAKSQELKDEFVASLKDVEKEVDNLIEVYPAQRNYFIPIKTSLKTIITLIDKYTDQVKSRFGAKDSLVIDGANEIEVPKFIVKSTRDLSRALKLFDSMYEVAKISYNLQDKSKDLDEYTVNYEEMTAKSIADILTDITKTYKKYSKEMDKTYEAIIKHAPADAKEKYRKTKSALEKLMKEQYDTRVKFWRTVEYIDFYMKDFTADILKNPKSIADIRSIISGSNVIGNWYNESTGQTLAKVFENANDNENTKVTVSSDKHYYEDINEALNDPNNLKNIASVDDAISALGLQSIKKNLNELFADFKLFKNIIAVLSYIDVNYGDKTKPKPMSSYAIYRNLTEFIKLSAYSQGKDVNLDDTLDLSSATLSQQQAIDDLEKRYKFYLNTVENENDSFVVSTKQEDRIFTYIIKSMVSKIFTLVGVKELLTKPHVVNSMSPLRLLIGASENVYEIPRVDENVVELYFRLVLLAQFYKNLFGFGEDDKDNKYNNNYDSYGGFKKSDISLKITMIPEVEGVFSELINYIFKKNEDLDNEIYSDNDVKFLIREINKIYQKMQSKYPENTVRKTIDDFVREINRRYGLVTREERNAYEQAFGHKYDYASSDVKHDRYSRDASVDYAILPDEEYTITNDFYQPTSKAESYSNVVITPNTPFNDMSKYGRKYTIHKDHYKLVHNFRCVLDKIFEDKDDTFSFNEAIITTKKRLQNEQDLQKRVNIIAELLRGSTIYDKVDGMKYVLFHETVVAGLNVLSIIHSLLSKFKRRVLLTDIQKIANYILANIRDEHNNQKTINALITELIDKNVLIDTDEIEKDYAKVILKNVFDINNQNFKQLNGIDTNIRKDDLLGKLHAITGPNNIDREQDKKKYIELISRYLVDNEYVMKELIESLFAISNDSSDLVKVQLSGDHININWGGLKTEISQMFDNVKYFIELLRPHLPDLVEKYTNKVNAGSYYWLQEQIMEKIIEGRPAQKRVDNPKKAYINLKRLTKIINNSYKILTREWKYIMNPTADPVEIQEPKYKKNTYDKVFAELIFYDARKKNSGLVISNEAVSLDNNNENAVDSAKLIDLYGKYHPFELLHYYNMIPRGVEMSPEFKYIDTKYVARFKQLYTWSEELTFNRSLMFSFNQFISKFIQNVFDPLTQHAYHKLIEPLVSGVFNNSIKNLENTYPDVLPTKVVIGSNLRQQQEALMRRSITGSYDLDQIKNHVTTTMVKNKLSFNNDKYIIYVNDSIKYELSATHLDIALQSLNNLLMELFGKAITKGTKFLSNDLFNLKVPVDAANNNKLLTNDSFPLYNTIDTIDKNGLTPNKSEFKHEYLLNLLNDGRLFRNKNEYYIIPKLSISNAGKTDDEILKIIKTFITAPREYSRIVFALLPNYSVYSIPSNNKVGVSYKEFSNFMEKYPSTNADNVIVKEYFTQLYIMYLLNTDKTDSLDETSLIKIYQRYLKVVFTYNMILFNHYHKQNNQDILIHEEFTSNNAPPEEKILNPIIVNVLSPTNAIGHTIPNVTTHISPIGAAAQYTPFTVTKGITFEKALAEFNSLALQMPINYQTMQQSRTNNKFAVNNFTRIMNNILYSQSNILLLLDELEHHKTLENLLTHFEQNQYDIKNTFSDIFNYLEYESFPQDAQGAIIATKGNTELSMFSIITKVVSRTITDDFLLYFNDEFRNLLDSLVFLGLVDSTNINRPITKDNNNISFNITASSVINQQNNEVTEIINVAKQIINAINMTKLPDDTIINNSYHFIVHDIINTLRDKDYESLTFDRRKYTLDDDEKIVSSEVEADQIRNAIFKFIETGDPILPSDENLKIKQDGTQFGERMDPDKNHVLFTSLAVIIKNLYASSVHRGMEKEYLAGDINMLSPSTREKLRSCLPILEKMFRTIASKAEFLKMFLNHRQMYVERYWIEQGSTPKVNPWPYKLLPASTNNQAEGINYSLNSETVVKPRFTGILDIIRDSSSVLVSSITNVHNELGGGNPNYLEYTYNGVSTYKSVHGTEPLMLLSSAMSVFDSSNDLSSETMLIPSHKDNNEKQKLIHAFGSLLNSTNKTVSLNPAWDTVVSGYNLFNRSNQQVDEAASKKYSTSFGKLLRFAYESVKVKSLLTPFVLQTSDGSNVETNPNRILHEGNVNKKPILRSGVFSRELLVFDANNEAIFNSNPLFANADSTITNKSTISMTKSYDNRIRTTKPVFSLVKPIEKVIDLTESSFKENKIKELGEYLLSRDTASSRKSLEVQNIIDLNIVPINIHALSREIPLINLYNYSYTFDRMLVELFYGGIGNPNTQKIIKELCDSEIDEDKIITPKDALVNLLIDPYLKIDDKYTHVKEMYKGSTGNGMNRPKFLSDQVFNKVLFGTIYDTPGSYNQTGPQTPSNNVLSTLEYIKRNMTLFINNNINDLIDITNVPNAPDVAPYLEEIYKELEDKYLDYVVQNNDSNKLNITTKDISDIVLGLVQIPLSTDEQVLFAFEDATGAADIANNYNGFIDHNLSSELRTKLKNAKGLHINHADNPPLQWFATYWANNIWTRAAIKGGANNDIKDKKETIKTFNDKVKRFMNAVTLGVDVDTANPQNNKSVLTYLLNSNRDLKGYGATIQSHDSEYGDNQVLDDNQVKVVKIPFDKVMDITYEGKRRFGSKLIRNLTFITNLFRVVQERIIKDLSFNNDVIIKSELITEKGITEFVGNQIYKPIGLR